MEDTDIILLRCLYAGSGPEKTESIYDFCWLCVWRFWRISETEYQTSLKNGVHDIRIYHFCFSVTFYQKNNHIKLMKMVKIFVFFICVKFFFHIYTFIHKISYGIRKICIKNSKQVANIGNYHAAQVNLFCGYQGVIKG